MFLIHNLTIEFTSIMYHVFIYDVPSPVGEARIRVQISAIHSTTDIDNCLEAFTDIGKKRGVIS